MRFRPALPDLALAGDEVKAGRYHRIKQWVFFAQLAASGLFLVLMQAAGFSLFLKTVSVNTVSSPWAQIPIYMTGFFCAFYAATLPLHFWSGYHLEKSFGLSDQRFGAWVWDEVKQCAISLPFFVLMMEGLFFFVRTFPGSWWALAGAAWLFVTLFLARIMPVVLVPIFYRTRELAAGDLKQRLAALCEKCGVKVLGITEILFSKKTKKANAALVGIGGSRRILLGDTLTKHFTNEEIEMVVAHELGHHVKRHIAKGLVLNFAVVLSGFYLLHMASSTLVRLLAAEGLDDLGIFPSLALLAAAAGLVILPAQNAVSRRHERQADRYALQMVPSCATFVSLMSKLGKQNLANPAPHPWIEFLFYDHPSIPRRIRYARSIRGGA